MLRIIFSLFVLNALVWAKKASIRDAPYTVAFVDPRGTLCSGAILNEKWIVTAGRCAFGYIQAKKSESNPEDAEVVAGASDWAVVEEPYKVESAIVHPNISHFNPYNNDIALIKLTTEIKFDEDTQPIALPDSDIQNDEFLKITGFMDAIVTPNTELQLQNVLAIKDNNNCDRAGAVNLFCVTKSENGTYDDKINHQFDLMGAPMVGADNKLAGIIYKIYQPKHKVVGLGLRIHNFSNWIKDTLQNN